MMIDWPHATAKEPWWHSIVAYQIYPASFCDSNGDGIGDIPGIISKLDYLAELGVGLIWLSPVHASPMVDNGYDISDYQAINPVFGSLDDMDRLIAEAKARGIGILMDLVVNHTSNQHAWFQAARSDRASPFRDYYIWRDSPPYPGSPEDIRATFGGSAWSRDRVSGDWYLHLFAPEQPDLNWANPELRGEIHRMMNWWLDRGIAGFRLDVIDLIGKAVDQGIVADGPALHDYLQDMHRQTLAGRGVVTVGEAWSATPENAALYSGPTRGELSMVFQFDHVTRFWDKELGKWKPLPVDLPALKQVFARWQQALHGKGWNSLFWGNHDLPRAVSRYGDSGTCRVASARMLATVLHLMQGTPFIFQGEEIGMTNAGFTTIDQYRDVETLNWYREQLDEGRDEGEFLAGAAANSRDNARTPMQWSAGPQAGFSSDVPWIAVNKNHDLVNVDRDRSDPNGVFVRYRDLIALRRRMPLIRQGSFHLLAADHPALFAYERRLPGECLLVIGNFSGEAVALAGSGIPDARGHDLFTGEEVLVAQATDLPPYGVLAILVE